MICIIYPKKNIISVAPEITKMYNELIPCDLSDCEQEQNDKPSNIPRPLSLDENKIINPFDITIKVLDDFDKQSENSDKKYNLKFYYKRSKAYYFDKVNDPDFEIVNERKSMLKHTLKKFSMAWPSEILKAVQKKEDDKDLHEIPRYNCALYADLDDKESLVFKTRNEMYLAFVDLLTYSFDTLRKYKDNKKYLNEFDSSKLTIHADDKKLNSLHLIYNDNYSFINKAYQKQFWEYVSVICEKKDKYKNILKVVDFNVYNINTSLRTLHSLKGDRKFIKARWCSEKNKIKTQSKSLATKDDIISKSKGKNYCIEIPLISKGKGKKTYSPTKLSIDNKIAERLLEFAPNTYLSSEKNNLFTFHTRDKQGYECPACKNNHDSNGWYAWISKGNVMCGCHGSEYKSNPKPRLLFVLESEQSVVSSIKFDTTDTNLAKLFYKFYGEDFIYIDDSDDGKSGYFYYFNGTYWKLDKGNRILMKKISNDFYFKLESLINEKMMQSNDDNHRKMMADIKRKFKVLQSNSKKREVLKELKIYLYKDVKLDIDPYILVFKNGVYDFNKFEFRKSKREEYISNTLNTGYDYEVSDLESLNLFEKNYINKILINVEDDKDVFLQMISTVLIGRRFKKFMILNGAGDNGKSNLMEVIMKMLGSYGFKIDVAQVCKGKKDNFTLNNINKKRFVYCEEPNNDNQFDSAFIKEFTGGNLSYRKLHSTKCDVKVDSLWCILCNEKPHLSKVGDAISERLIDFPFLSKFVDNNINGVNRFKKDETVDTEKFKDDSKLLMFHYLLPSLKKFINLKCKIKLTKNLTKRRDQYLLDSDELYRWFSSTYEYVSDKHEYITIKQLYSSFKNTEFYRNLPKKDKREMNKKRFEERMLGKKPINSIWEDEYKPYIKGKQKCIRNCLVGIKLIELEEEDSDSDEDVEL